MAEAASIAEKIDARAGARITRLRIDGMTCGNCARHVTEALRSVAGVQNASVALESQSAEVRWASGAAAKPLELIRAVVEAGYDAKPAPTDKSKLEKAGIQTWKLNLWLGALATLPLMIGEWALGLGMVPWFRWTSLVLAGVVQVMGGAAFYRGAWRQLKRGASNMDTLVALGSTVAFAYSVWAIFAQPGAHLYFLESAAIITLISIGHSLEARVSERASSEMRHLLRLAPATALKQMPDGSQKEVSVADLRAGDVVALRPGDHVPVDGQVIEGSSAVNESMLTGESLPVEKSKNARVFAGTENLDGRLLVRVFSTGEETALARIINAVQRAQSSRAEIQRLGDRVSNYFVPVVVVVAIGAFVWWGFAPGAALHVTETVSKFLWPPHIPSGPIAAGLIIGAAVLIVACPCAMGLATPAAIMAASNAAARKGILIRDGVALEKAGKISVVMLDKTGTLTKGTPVLIKSAIFDSGSVNDGQKIGGDEIAAALAAHSRHPVSRAIAAGAKSELSVQDWEEIRGSGVRGTLRADSNGMKAMLGSLPWLRENAVDLRPGEAFIKEWSGRGATIVGLALNAKLGSLFAVSDTLKEGTREMIGQLRNSGLTPYLITGDNRITGEAIAKETGISLENVFAEVRPEAKAGMVSQLQAKGEKVAFVGDGINDGPALEQADLGIAVLHASDTAREAADMVLLNSDVHSIPESLHLARKALRIIKQNLFWAFFYNALGVPLAALGFMSPVVCAAAMAISDLVVIGNALRLLRRG